MGDAVAGEQVRRRVLGDEHVDRSLAGVTDLNRHFFGWITENVWGDLWSNDTFDDHTRSLITVAILAALGREELAIHLAASARTGVTDVELAQVLQHVAVYAGVPAANHAFAVAQRARPAPPAVGGAVPPTEVDPAGALDRAADGATSAAGVRDGADSLRAGTPHRAEAEQ